MKPFLLSIYDLTGTWSAPYKKAGWRVMLWDKQIEGCILENFSYLCWLIDQELQGEQMTGLLAALPCTAFAGSGARWWPDKDAPSDEYLPFDSFTEYMQALAWIVWELKERYNPIFWAFENPVGRIEKLIPEIKRYRQLTFHPCDFGEPYTKKTILWGEFNAGLPRNPVEPTEGSKMHKIPPGKDRANLRSETPKGFAEAFYQANHQFNIKQMDIFNP